MFMSKRNIPLAVSSNFNDPNPHPILTVELSTKWYELYLIQPDGKVEGVFFPTSDKYTSFVDHVPNPIVVQEYAAAKGYYLDELAFDLIVGRWYNEVKDYNAIGTKENVTLAKGVLAANLALDIDMGDGETTYQCCNAVCGHCNCLVGDALLIAKSVTKLSPEDLALMNKQRKAPYQVPLTPRTRA